MKKKKKKNINALNESYNCEEGVNGIKWYNFFPQLCKLETFQNGFHPNNHLHLFPSKMGFYPNTYSIHFLFKMVVAIFSWLSTLIRFLFKLILNNDWFQR